MVSIAQFVNVDRLGYLLFLMCRQRSVEALALAEQDSGEDEVRRLRVITGPSSTAVIQMFAAEASPRARRRQRARPSSGQSRAGRTVDSDLGDSSASPGRAGDPHAARKLTEVSSEAANDVRRGSALHIVDVSSGTSALAASVSLDIEENRSVAKVRDEEPKIRATRRPVVSRDVTSSKHELASRKGGRILPLSVDRLPQNDLQKAVQKLSEKHNFDEIAALKPNEVTEEVFVAKLHNVNIEDMDRLLKSSETTDETSKKAVSRDESYTNVMKTATTVTQGN